MEANSPIAIASMEIEACCVDIIQRANSVITYAMRETDGRIRSQICPVLHDLFHGDEKHSATWYGLGTSFETSPNVQEQIF